ELRGLVVEVLTGRRSVGRGGGEGAGVLPLELELVLLGDAMGEGDLPLVGGGEVAGGRGLAVLGGDLAGEGGEDVRAGLEGRDERVVLGGLDLGTVGAGELDGARRLLGREGDHEGPEALALGGGDATGEGGEVGLDPSLG